ncbi:hypothetical protein LZ31DRAFT_347587 [Colletotrichum somersetense]|nr:hypothetical protein LZ31DRAFT_347587 [Colletotrichum somersetense]
MGIPTAPEPDGRRPYASGHNAESLGPRSSHQRAYNDKPSRSFPTSGLPPLRAVPPAPLPLRALTGLRAVVSPSVLYFFSPSRHVCSLRYTKILRAFYRSFLSPRVFRLGQALLLRAQVSIGLSIIPQYALRAPSSPSVPFNASLRALFRGLFRAPHAITSCSVPWGTWEPRT